ncbi:hypothetical protein [Streptomyces mirabilis]|uniref:hypothetical protein n=1 Tax=Streptomyces mirabilis TaxID=68239 RepID=UPI0036C4675F
MPQTQPDRAVRAADIYLLFAHEPYYPGPGAQEINTTLVAAATLLHPRVRQPDGAQIHDRLTQGRQPGEIVPLATLTHELNGGADWPTVGDWESVTTDLLQLVRDGECDASASACPRSRGPSSAPDHTATCAPATPRLTSSSPTDRRSVPPSWPR